MDLVKSKLFGKLDREGKNIDPIFDEWKTLIEYIPDVKIQERFLRHFYNALKMVYGIENLKKPQATGATIIGIYEEIINSDAERLFSALKEKAKIYSALQVSIADTEPQSEEIWEEQATQELIKLNFVGGATSHAFLLWLDHIAELKGWDRGAIVFSMAQYLRNWFCWRNLTGYPGTPELDKMFMKFIEEITREIDVSGSITKGEDLIKKSKELLVQRAPAKDMCKDKLCGDIYDENRGVTHYILACIEDISSTKENPNPSWEARKGGQSKMSIEHILPQAKDIKDDWVKMLVGDEKSSDPKTDAKDIQGRCLHKLGNLTLTAYNANLSSKPFQEKRDAQDSKGNSIGFKNGLYLNSVVEPKLCDLEKWNEALIEQRTKSLAD